MPIKFDLLARSGALPPTDADADADADMQDVELDDDDREYHDDDVVDRAAPQDRMRTNAAPASKATAHCYSCFSDTATGAFVVLAGRVAAAFGAVFGFIVLVFWASEPRMFDIHFSDWFFWVVWLVHAVALALAFLSRMTGRCWRVADGRLQPLDVGSTPYKVFTRDPFTNTCEGVLVGVANFVQAGLVIASMFVIMQAMLSEGTYLHELKLAWTIAYICQSLAVWLQILSDCLTLYLVYARTVRMPFLLSSLAGVLACFCVPVFTFGYALYAAACCSGDWGGLIF